MTTRNNTPVRNIKFTGLQDAKSIRAIGRTGFKIADNVDITNEFEVERRPGRTLVRSGGVDALWGDNIQSLFTASNSLYRLEADESEVLLASGLTTSSVLAVARAGDKLYWSNDYQTGVVEGNASRSLGLPVPSAPVLASVGGALPEGAYAVAISFIRSDTQESGLSPESLINLTSSGGLSVAIPATSSDADVSHVGIYCSAPNGTQLYLLGTVKLGAPAFVFNDSVRRLGVYPAMFKFAGAPPPFQCAAICNSRLVVGSGDVVFYSYPYAYEVMDLRFNYIPLQTRVEVIAAVEGGTFVGTENEIYYMAGDIADPSDVRVVASYGAVRNSHPMQLESHELNVDRFSGRGVLLVTKRGYGLCLDGGSYINITEGEVVFPTAPVTGSGVVRRINGTVHALSVVNS